MRQPQAPVLSCDGLSKSYDRDILRDVALSVAGGEVLCVRGKSGSGKSTLLHCLAGIERPDSGSVQVDGVRLDSLRPSDVDRLRASVVGFVFQFGQLVNELTVVENVALPLMLNGTSRPEAVRRASDELEKVDVVVRAHAFPRDISGGEAQRVAVARAFVTSPRVVLADEPTGSLDSVNADLVSDLLVRTARQGGAALLIATHDQDLAERADRVIELVDGRIVSDGRQVAR